MTGEDFKTEGGEPAQQERSRAVQDTLFGLKWNIIRSKKFYETEYE